MRRGFFTKIVLYRLITHVNGLNFSAPPYHNLVAQTVKNLPEMQDKLGDVFGSHWA
jgi:hypothetical protein